MRKFWRHEGAATAIEYGLIASLIAVVIIGSVSSVGTRVSSLYGSVVTSMAAAR